ncbi:CRISPR-associated endonuclease Cas2 [Pseudomonas sp. F1_0610]|uniref:CRISPR-associated endonuclease Cas2 n=1 Tax=Pseudomonas sp. F1_0610 TaxID=3114284 RepID=UPI0039C2C1CF
MSTNKRWYLIQYDIRNKQRLRKVHKLLSSISIPIQESVFAWLGTEKELDRLQQKLKSLINLYEDDIRGYLIKHPIILYGQSPFTEDVYFDNYPPYAIKPI